METCNSFIYSDAGAGTQRAYVRIVTSGARFQNQNQMKKEHLLYFGHSIRNQKCMSNH
mgnify:FL=1